MTDKDLARKKRAETIAKQDVSIWEALIGAAGQPNVQKFIILPRLYAFTRTALNVNHPVEDREKQLLHNYINNDGSNSVHNFIKFVDGRMTIEEARELQENLTEMLAAA